MRIGLVLPAVPAYSETFFRNKIRFLQEAPGFEVVLFADRYSADTFDLCPVHYAVQFSSHPIIALFQYLGYFIFIGFRSPGKIFQLWRLNDKAGYGLKKNLASVAMSAHIFKQEVDWLHFGFGTMALGREHVARVVGAKMAVSFRGFDIAIYPLKHKNCYSLLWETVDTVHVISDDLLQLVHKQGYPNKKPAIKITPAIDINKFKRAHKANVGSNVLQFITVARLHWKKGLEYTLEALAQVRNLGIDFHYTIIGEGEERERLIFAVHQLGLKDQVTFTGRLGQAEIIEMLHHSDLYLQYSIQEGFCNAVLEAQAMGLLCVVSDAEGLAENVLHEQTGWVVPKRRPDMLAAKIEEVVRLDEVARTAVQNRAIQRVKDNFNLEKQGTGFCTFYLQTGQA